MTNLKRTMRLNLERKKDLSFEVTNKKSGEKIFGAEEEYYIYMKNVNFTKDGIVGTFLGLNPDILIDDKCMYADFNDSDGWTIREHGDKLRTGKLVAVKNNSDVIIIIHR